MSTLERACAAAGIEIKRGLLGRYATDGDLRCRLSAPEFEDWLMAALMEAVAASPRALAGYHRRTLYFQRDADARMAAAVSALEEVKQ